MKPKRFDCGQQPATCALAVLLVLSAAPRADARPRHAREVVRRALHVTDANADAFFDVHVAFGTATTLAFQQGIRDRGVTFADVNGRFYPPQLNDKALLLVPKADLKPKEVLELTVELVDGTLLPFKLSTLPDEADGQVDVFVELSKRAAPESLGGLKEQLQTVQSRLDECEGGAAGQGTSKLAALLLQQDLAKPQSFLAVRSTLHKLDKQARLLVEARVVYRLIDTSYLVMTVENRDPSRPWVMDRARLSLGDGSSTEEVRVLASQAEVVSLPPGEEEKVVIAFRTPVQGANHSFMLELLEKGGSRHIKLEDVSL
jgi:uncharacterized protein (TIGR02268 family)